MALNVSVVLPTHDRPDSLRRAVDAILAQTLKPYELIIVNDGTEQIDPAIAEQAGSAGVQMSCLRQDFASSTASRNCGMAVAQGDVVLLVDDDVVLPGDYLARLVELYEADSDGLIAGIGGLYREPQPKSIGRHIWDVLTTVLGQVRWQPRVIAARYLSLPSGLRGKLVPARLLVGGATSLRGRVAATERFEQSLTGYAFAEDREFTCRVGRNNPLFVAPGLKVLHERAHGGRPDMHHLGRAYIANSLHIARHSVDGGAGTCLLVGYDFLGTMLVYAAWAVIRPRRGNIRFAAGMLAELLAEARRAAGKMLCGS